MAGGVELVVRPRGGGVRGRRMAGGLILLVPIVAVQLAAHVSLWIVAAELGLTGAVLVAELSYLAQAAAFDSAQPPGRPG